MTAESDLYWRGRRIDGVILDLDGTLTDSIDVYFRAFQETGREFGITFDRESVLRPLAEGEAPWNRAVLDDPTDAEEKMRQFKREARKRFTRTLDQVRPLHGVDGVLAALTARGLKLGVVTDSPAVSFKVLDDYSLSHYFSAMISQNDGVPRKPEPDGIILCLQAMGVSPSNAVTVGDSLLDIWAGRRAGTLTVGVLTGLATRSQFMKADPTAVVERVTDVLSLWGLD